jgi:hypothetical protein
MIPQLEHSITLLSIHVIMGLEAHMVHISHFTQLLEDVSMDFFLIKKGMRNSVSAQKNLKLLQ